LDNPTRVNITGIIIKPNQAYHLAH
jgi:hypothetical protein